MKANIHNRYQIQLQFTCHLQNYRIETFFIVTNKISKDGITQAEQRPGCMEKANHVSKT